MTMKMFHLFMFSSFVLKISVLILFWEHLCEKLKKLEDVSYMKFFNPLFQKIGSSHKT